MKHNFLHCIVIAVFLSIVPASLRGLAAQRQLPEIELPEYIIVGVERATLIKGERLAPRSVPDVRIPEPVASKRPSMHLEAVAMTPVKPTLKLTVSDGYLRANGYGGGFGAYGASLVAVKNDRTFTLNGGLRLDNLPRRLGNGPAEEWSLGGAVSSSVGGSTVGSFQVDYTRARIELNSNSDLEWDDVTIGLNFTPIATGIGVFTFGGNSRYRNYAINTDLGYLSGNLIHGTGVGDFRVVSSLMFGSEYASVAGYNFLNLKTIVEKRYGDGLFISLGLSGYSLDEEDTRGIRPLVRVRLQLAGSSEAIMEWAPRTYMITAFQQEDIFPMAEGASSLTVEETERLRITYRKSARNWDLTVGGEYLVSRKYPEVLHTDTTGGNRPVFRYDLRKSVLFKARLDMKLAKSMRLSVGGKIDNPVDNGDDVKGITPISINSEFRQSLYGFDLSNSLTWYSETPFNSYSNTRQLTGFKRDAYLAWDLSLSRSFWRSFGVELEIDNALNEQVTILRGYDAAPMTVRVNLWFGASDIIKPKFNWDYFQNQWGYE